MNRYQPFGGAREMFNSTDPIILFDGPRNTGKSLAVLHKAYYCADRYPGCRILLCRKHRASMTDTIMATFEEEVLPPGHYLVDKMSRTNRHNYQFRNGSEIVLGSLEFVDRLRSAQFDMICIHEAAVGVSEDDYTILSATLFRHNKMPFSQLILECNPSYPQHWAYKLHLDDKLKRIRSLHSDNPYITEEFKKIASQWTGFRYQRDWLGEWCAAEGLVYDNYISAVQDFDPSQLEGEFVGGADFGWIDPTVFIVGVVQDGILYIWYERYKSQTLLKDHLKFIPDALYFCDSADPASIFEMNGGGKRATKAATKDISMGIMAVQTRIANGTIKIHPKCTSLLSEFSMYQWDPAKPDYPIKQHDHAMDALRYLIVSIDRRRIGT